MSLMQITMDRSMLERSEINLRGNFQMKRFNNLFRRWIRTETGESPKKSAKSFCPNFLVDDMLLEKNMNVLE